MDEQARLGPFEINPVLLRAVTVEVAFFAMELPEFFGIGLVEVLGQEVEFAEDLELEHFGQLGQLAGAAVVEDDLEHNPLLATKERREHKEIGKGYAFCSDFLEFSVFLCG